MEGNVTPLECCERGPSLYHLWHVYKGRTIDTWRRRKKRSRAQEWGHAKSHNSSTLTFPILSSPGSPSSCPLVLLSKARGSMTSSVPRDSEVQLWDLRLIHKSQCTVRSSRCRICTTQRSKVRGQIGRLIATRRLRQ
jgi:hypothetical protein